jgi:hypothetical protein
MKMKKKGMPTKVFTLYAQDRALTGLTRWRRDPLTHPMVIKARAKTWRQALFVAGNRMEPQNDEDVGILSVDLRGENDGATLGEAAAWTRWQADG